MQTVSTAFETKSKATTRKVDAKILIDWNNDGTFTDETERLKVIETERKITEPLGGIHVGQFDVVLHNEDDRYTRGVGSPINDYLINGRRF